MAIIIATNKLIDFFQSLFDLIQLMIAYKQSYEVPCSKACTRALLASGNFTAEASAAIDANYTSSSGA